MNTKNKLVYRVSPFNGSIVFTTLEQAQRVDRINRAIRESSNWLEFREAIPSEDYSEIYQQIEDCDEAPSDSDVFDESQVPGFDEGDFPPWLQREMDMLIPQAILKRFAARETGATSGSFWTIPAANLLPILEALKADDFEIEEADGLEFH